MPLRIQHLADCPRASAIPALFKKEGLPYESLAVVNWPSAFPYKPQVEFALAHTGESLLLHFKVREKSTGARCAEDGGRVWEDSCVEFFFRPEPSQMTYYNIECNCIGKLMFSCGEGRHNRTMAPVSALAQIDRWSSLGDVPFAEQAVGVWEVCLVIPVSAFFRHRVDTLAGTSFLANFYKCGDRLETPHYLSFAPIDTPAPDFHRPEYFVPLVFAAI